MQPQFIRPSADLRNKYSEISQLCKTTHEPVYITVNGRGDTVIIDMAQYIAMCKELELLQELAEAESDIESGHVAPVNKMFTDVRKALSEINNA